MRDSKAERVKDEETSQEDASDEDNIDKLKEEPLNRSKSEEEKELKETHLFFLFVQIWVNLGNSFTDHSFTVR